MALARSLGAENIAAEGKRAFAWRREAALGVIPKMKISYLLFGVLALSATSVLAAPTDSDGNGSYSMEEMAEAYPDLTEEEFADMDANEDGEIDEVELADAIDAGMIEG